MSIRLVEGGLAMVAGQSCIAGPSVYLPSYRIRFLYSLHLPFFRIGNKKSFLVDETVQQMSAQYECTHTAHVRSVTGPYSDRTRIPVKQLISL